MPISHDCLLPARLLWQRLKRTTDCTVHTVTMLTVVDRASKISRTARRENLKNRRIKDKHQTGLLRFLRLKSKHNH